MALESMLRNQTFGCEQIFALLEGVFSSYIAHAREVRERNSHLKLFYGLSFETAVKKCAGGVAEYRASEHKTMEV